MLLSGWRLGRLILAAAAGPVLFAIGLGPLVPALAGLVPRWPARLWAAGAAVAATVAWQIAAGADALLAGGGFTASAVRDLEGERSPAVVLERLWQPLADRPPAGLQALALVAAAMCVPLVLRARAGRPAGDRRERSGWAASPRCWWRPPPTSRRPSERRSRPAWSSSDGPSGPGGASAGARPVRPSATLRGPIV